MSMRSQRTGHNLATTPSPPHSSTHTACMRSYFSRVQLCNPKDHSLPGSSVHGISQARILEWFAMPSSRGSSRPRNRTSITYISCTGRWLHSQQHHLGSPISKLLDGLLEASLCGLSKSILRTLISLFPLHSFPRISLIVISVD